MTEFDKLAIGTVQFGMDYGIGNQNGQVHGYEIEAILDLAWRSGIDTLDTAKAYGNSEEAIGNHMKQRPESSWYIITKLSDMGGNIAGQVQDSTAKLTRKPSIILAHSAELFMYDDFQKELTEFKSMQFIGKMGVSLYNEDEIIQVMESGFKPEVIQLPLNILDTKLYRNGTLAELNNEGIEIHVRSAFLQGLFYLPEVDLKKHFSDAVPYIKKLKSIAATTGLTLAELSLLWLVSLEEVSRVVIGVDNVKQLEGHLDTLGKNIDSAVFQEALSIICENENILNPSLWPSTL